MEDPKASKRQASGVTVISTDTEQSEEERDEKFMGDNLQNFGWKAILLLQFQPQFELVIMIAIYLSYICPVLDFSYAFSTKADNIPNSYRPMGMNIIYYFDIIYAVDITLMIMYKNVKWVEMQHLYDERHALFVVLDIISTIPLDGVYYSLTEAYMRIIYGLRMRYTLRIFRLLRKVHRMKNIVGVNHFLMELLNFFINFTLLLVTVSCVWYLLECESHCGYVEILQMKKAFYVMTGKITSRGYPVSYPKQSGTFFLYMLTNLFSFVYISGFVVGLLLVALIGQAKRKFMLDTVRDLLLEKVRKLNVKDDLVYRYFYLFFDLFWKTRKGVLYERFNPIMLPEVMIKEINLDISWDALKHSHLFRDREVYFLRFVSSFMKQKFMLPGETIYRRGLFKSSMVYLVRGVIQILSEQDSETPILSFSGGTCIGESTLFIDYPSTCNVICQSYCEVHVLYRKDFLKVILKYPEVCRVMLRNIWNRNREAKKYQHLLDFAYDKDRRKREVLKLKWLKATLQDVMIKDGISETENQKKKTLTLEERHTIKEFDKLVFCCNYLDSLVMTEKVQLVTDTVFLRASCPCILQPDSFIVATWSKIILIAVFVFSLVYPYHASFFPKPSTNYFIFSCIITILWILDVYINISTGVKTKGGIVVDIRKIIMYKCQRLEFVADMIAAFPLELLAVFVGGYPGTQTFVLLQSLKLLKMYRIGYFFDEIFPTVGIILRIYLKYALFTFLMVYYVAALLYLRICYNFMCDQTSIVYNFIHRFSKGDTRKVILLCMSLTVQQLTTLGLKIPAKGSLDHLYIEIIIVEIVVTLFFVNCLANIATTENLSQHIKLKMREYTSNVLMTMRKLNVNPELCREVALHIRGQLAFHGGADILYNPSEVANMFNPILGKESRKYGFLPKLKLIPLFAEWPHELLGNLAAVFYTNVLMTGETLTYSGEVCTEMHFLVAGFCKMYSSSDQAPKVIGPGSSVSVVEMCCGLPVVNTVKTLTHCRFVTIKHVFFMKELQLYPELLHELKETCAAVVQSINAETLINQEDFKNEHQVTENVGYGKGSFKRFGYNLDLKTKEGAEYHGPFDKLEVFGFLRYLFMRHTIRPYGRFICYWEISRCIFAFLAALLAPSGILATCPNCGWDYILLFLDMTAWIDIYLRHHICYFDERGIEITHPLKTAIYYWKHGFLIDILGVLPFERILAPLFASEVKNKNRIFLRSVRMLQVHRIMSGILFISEDLMLPPRWWTITKYVPIVIVIINGFGLIYMNVRCNFGPDIKASRAFAEGIVCHENGWIEKSGVSKPLTPLRTQMYVLYVTTMLATGPGMEGFSAQDTSEVLSLTLMTIIGYLLFFYVSTKVIATNVFKNTNLRSYQEAMRDLVSFLSYRHIDSKLKREVIEHFEHVWRRNKGKSLHAAIESFNLALQETVLLDVYGKVMKESVIFAEANSSFFRSLLLNVEHEYFMKRGIITTVNNVHNKMYFVLKGQVEVLGPDYNRLLILPVGSLFGHIDDCLWSRQTLTMVAKGHVELLSIRTGVFYKILSKYHHLNRHFRKLTSFNTDYLLGALSALFNEESLTRATYPTSSAPFRSTATLNVIFSNFKQIYAVFVWQNIILVLVCYIGFMLELYQMTVQDHSLQIITFLYILDILLLIDMYLKFKTAYEDEFGILVTDRRQIALRFIKDPYGFPLYVASVIPLEMFSLVFLGSGLAWRIWSYLRCNRFIRICLIIDYFRRKTMQLNINASVIRTLGLLVWISLFLQVFTSILLQAICLNPEYHAVPLTNCKWDKMTESEKWVTYKFMFVVIQSIFTSSAVDHFFPNSPLLSFIVISLLIGSRFVFTYFVAEVTATLAIVHNTRTQYQENIDIVKEHIVRQQLSPVLLDRIWLYLCVLWKKKGGLQFPTLLLTAPRYLREGVLNAMFGCYLRKHKIFGRCHKDMLRQMAGQMYPRTFFSGDYITFVNDTDGCMYFIHEGAVDVLSEDDLYSEKIDRVLYKNDMFGLQQGIDSRIGHEYTYRANRCTVVLVLERKNWVHLLDFFPASKEILFSHMEIH